VLDRVKHAVRGRLQPYIDRSVDERIRIQLGGTLENAAAIIPISPAASTIVTPRSVGQPDLAPVDMPLPPRDLWEVEASYLEDGERHVEVMREALTGAGWDGEGAVLDFGCGAGRLTRWWAADAKQRPVWGVDINAPAIDWARAHLSPPLDFAVCSSLPTLPFADGAFGLVFGASVFTHLSEMADSWLLELLRVTRPDGYLYVTIQDQAYIERTRAIEGSWTADFVKEHETLLAGLGSDSEAISIGRGVKTAMVFHDRASLIERWGRWVQEITPVEAAMHMQTALVMRK
jgi:SAM-dependent methyltransferase